MNRIKIRRPLALVCLLFMAAVSLLLLILPAADMREIPEGENIRLKGELFRKEFRKNADGIREPVWYVRTKEERPCRVQCYPSAETGTISVPIGATVDLSGRARSFSEATNPGEFDAASYYRILGIDLRLTQAELRSVEGGGGLREQLFLLRSRLEHSLEDCLYPEDAGILSAMILGDRSAMDEETKDLYRQSGIIHILAVSGLHITLIGMGLFRLLHFLRCPRWLSIPVSMLAMLAYGEMCGQTPSAVRAIIMFLMRLTALFFGYSYDIITALAVAALLLVIEQPLYLTYSGFLFSFLSVLAISVLYPQLAPGKVTDYVPARGDPVWKPWLYRGLSAFFASFSVTLVTLPLYMLTYFTFPVYAILLNLLILPLMAIVVGGGIVCMGFGLLWIPAGMLAGVPDHLLLKLFRFLCLSENALPGATWVTGHASCLQVFLYYVLLAVFVAVVYRLRGSKRDVSSERFMGVSRGGSDGASRGESDRRGLSEWLSESFFARVLFFAFAVLVLALRFPKPLTVTVLDVGQGDGIVIKSDDIAILIDGGSSSRTGIDKYVLKPFLAYSGIDHLDAAILTHEDSDHMNGLLALMENEDDFLSIDRLYLPCVEENRRGEGYGQLLSAAEKHGIPMFMLQTGGRILDGSLTLQCLGPPKDLVSTEPNAHSTILYLTYGSFRALFTGDVEGEGEAALLKTLADNPSIARDLTLLKVAHHGSAYTTCGELLDRLHPGMAAISCGRNNRYGHPHKELMDRLASRGIRIYVTAEQGALTFTVSRDGGNMRVRGFLDE